MAPLRKVISDDVRVIVCLAFDDHAPETEVARFKQWLLERDYVLHAVELTGTFDLMIEASVPSLAEYHESMESLKKAAPDLIDRYEPNFICRRFIRHAGRNQAIWVPCEDGKMRIDHERINMVAAEGDYMRLHCADASHLVHATMHAMSDLLGEDFVQVHRSMLIRCDFIDRLLHRDLRWIVQMKDGSQVTVAKSHVAEVMSKLNIAPSKNQSISSTSEDLIEQLLSDPSKSASGVGWG